MRQRAREKEGEKARKRERARERQRERERGGEKEEEEWGEGCRCRSLFFCHSGFLLVSVKGTVSSVNRQAGSLYPAATLPYVVGMIALTRSLSEARSLSVRLCHVRVQHHLSSFILDLTRGYVAPDDLVQVGPPSIVRAKR